MALPPNKIFQNKKAYDPGRLRHGIAIMEYALIDDGFGGTTEQEQQILATKAGKEGVSEYKKAQLVGGYTNYDESIYFIIRNRKNFYPNKTMHINYGANSYTIIEVQELDDPCTYLKILCVVSS